MGVVSWGRMEDWNSWDEDKWTGEYREWSEALIRVPVGGLAQGLEEGHEKEESPEDSDSEG